jgi:hypothetical protein
LLPLGDAFLRALNVAVKAQADWYVTVHLSGMIPAGVKESENFLIRH